MKRGIGKFFRIARSSKERGFTLLEYCAGAAVVLAILYVALRAMGGNMSTMMSRVGDWATVRGDEITNVK